jgi:hypothetical protein
VIAREIFPHATPVMVKTPFGRADGAREASPEGEMSESTRPDDSRAGNDPEPTACVPEPIDDVPPIDDAPVPPLTSPNETQGG